MNQPIRVLVVDDSSFMRRALSRQIETDPRFKVIDTASDGKEAVAKALQLKPDVMTLDVEMPVMDGISALREIVAKTTVPVVMLSAVTQAGAKTTMEALEIGAIDFIPKARSAESIHEKLLIASQSTRTRKIAPVRAAPAAPVRAAPEPRLSSVIRRDAQLLVIGSSTGGPNALQQVLRDIPANFPIPIVIAQHMPGQFTTALAKRLDETCPLNVVEAKDGDALTKGKVYIAPGGFQMRVTRSSLKIDADAGESLYKPSVNVLAESAVKAFSKSLIGVMLTGMGNDGTKEFVKLRQGGGHTISQDQATSVVYGMPRSLIEANGADEVLPLERIGHRLRSLMGLA